MLDIKTKQSKNEVYNRIEDLVRDKICVLEKENSQLKQDLALAQAKLEVYERLASISGAKAQLGFGPPL